MVMQVTGRLFIPFVLIKNCIEVSSSYLLKFTKDLNIIMLTVLSIGV